MKKLYLYTFVYFVVFCCLHYNIFAKTTDNLPESLKPTPVKALPVRFKPLPFKPLHLTKVDLYQFDQKAYVFGKITSAFPVLTAQEWQTVSNDPVRFTLIPDKQNAYVGEEIELTLTAELLNISPSVLFTFEELREYTLKVVLPNDFIQTGGTYYDFISDKLDVSNPKKTYTIKGRYLAKPDMADCFKVLRKLNNDVFVLKATQCPIITEVDIASSNMPVVSDSLKKTREIAAIDLSKIKYSYVLTSNEYQQLQLSESELTIYLNCLQWNNYGFGTYINDEGLNEIKNNNGSINWEIIEKEGNTILLQYSTCSAYAFGLGSLVVPRTTSITSTLKIYSANLCPSPGSATPLYTKSITYTLDRTSACPTPPAPLTISASSTTICSGGSATLTASNNCSGTITWYKNSGTCGTGLSLTVTDAANYKAVCSSPALTSNIIPISVNSTPAAPTVTTDKYVLTPGEFAQFTASNCSGTILWTGPNNFTDIGSQISVNKTGGYNAKCQTSCGGTYYYSGLSATINISVSALRIEANKSEIRPGESVTLKAYGCTNGYIKWKINDNLQTSNDNPFTFASSGFYSASCNSWDGSYTSDWVNIFINQLPANTPTVAANKTRAYNNESVVLTATGCTTYYWAIPVRQANGSYVTPTPYPSSTSGSRTVTGPTTYSVSCTNQGPWASVTVGQIQPGDITINSNKLIANSGEAVVFNITGDCPSNAGIQWRIAGENSWTTRNESKTVYGPGIYEARCIIDDYSYGNWTSIRINTPVPGGITISASKTSAAETEQVTLRANGCDGEVIWTWTIPQPSPAPPITKVVRGTNLLFTTGPSIANGPITYTAKCVRFGITGAPATIVIQPKNNAAPRFYATQPVASGNQIFELVAENCPNNYVQWGVPKLDANGNTYYDYANFFPTLIVRGPGTYKVRCNEGNYTDFQDIVVFSNPSDALTIVANKSRAIPGEEVKLTAFGCPNGYVEWELSPTNFIGVQLITNGPGTYKARCIGDPTNNGDYAVATIIPNGSIVPIINGPNIACPTESISLNIKFETNGTSGTCPAGWPMQWQYVKPDKIDYWLNNRNAIENFGENYGEVFTIAFGNSINAQGPGIYYARCMKPDGTWLGEFKDKSLIVEPVFPQYLRASNNGPALLGATGIKVAVTEVPGPNITYSWVGPGFTSSSRNPDITGLSEAKSGIYTVTVSRTGTSACNVTATTNLVVSGCDIKIVAKDPESGVEATVLRKNPNNPSQYSSLALSAVYRDGTEINNNVTYTWTAPNGVSLPNANASYIPVSKSGTYKLRINPTGNTTVGCKTSIQIAQENSQEILWSKKWSTTFTNGTAVKVVPLKYNQSSRKYITTASNLTIYNSINKYLGHSMMLLYTKNNVSRTDILHVIPTEEYSNTHTSISPADFSGVIMMYDKTETIFRGGWKYTNGVVQGRVAQYALGYPTDDCVVRTVMIDVVPFTSSAIGTSMKDIHSGTGSVENIINTLHIGEHFTISGTEYVYNGYTERPCCVNCVPTGSSAGEDPPSTSNESPANPNIIKGTPPSYPITTFGEVMCRQVAQLLACAEKNTPQSIMNRNADYSPDVAAAKMEESKKRFVLYVKLIEQALRNHPVLKPYASQMNFPSETTVEGLTYSYGGAITNTNSYELVGCSITASFGTADVPKSQIEVLEDDLANVCNQIDQIYKSLVPMIQECNNASGVVTNMLNSIKLDNKNAMDVFQLGDITTNQNVTTLWNGLKGTLTPQSTNNPQNPNEIFVIRTDGVKVRYSPTNIVGKSYLKFTKEDCEDKIEGMEYEVVWSGNPSVPTKILLITPSLPDPCMRIPIFSVIKSLDNSNFFQRVLQGFKGPEAEDNLLQIVGSNSSEFGEKVGLPGASQQVAYTSFWNQYNNYTVRFNTDVLKGASQELLTAVLLHELVRVDAFKNPDLRDIQRVKPTDIFFEEPTFLFQGVKTKYTNSDGSNMNYIDCIIADLSQKFPNIPNNLIKALALSGINTFTESLNTYAKNKYGYTTQEASTAIKGFTNGTLGTKKCN